MIEDVSTSQTLKILEENQNNKNFFIIDCRTPREFAFGHFEKAVNIDFYSPSFFQELDKLDKNKRYLIYCRTGSRSKAALGIMERLGFKEVYNMKYGILDLNPSEKEKFLKN